MIKELFEEIDKFFPLCIHTAYWDNTNLILDGIDWSFSTTSPWRFIDSRTMVFGCTDREVCQVIAEIQSCKIIFIKAQTNNFPVDPVFGFSNGYKLEIFSCASSNSWKFKLPTGKIYEGKPFHTA